ncbi:hypothetical protein BJ138DRAFT_1105421 [Hygrophoropsis aurantiaca]|uniref:Uncharacterized protein n=1 Tax=Hygrophoropsis aurantiaca TaxID=72124 RepID=A0ACB8A0J7_9AGAM|nr:hypothetical protein BJ138DRAFT_1105421 [Hygrophoropsis aurantiaca]
MGKSKARRGKVLVSSKAKAKARAPPPDSAESDSDIPPLVPIPTSTPQYALDSDPQPSTSSHASSSSTQPTAIQTSFTCSEDQAAHQLRRLTEFLHELSSLQERKFTASIQLMVDMGTAKRDWLLAHPRVPLSAEAEERIMSRFWEENARLKEVADTTCKTQLTPSEGGKPRFFYMVTPPREEGGEPQMFIIKDLEGFRYRLAKDELLKDNITLMEPNVNHTGIWNHCPEENM